MIFQRQLRRESYQSDIELEVWSRPTLSKALRLILDQRQSRSICFFSWTLWMSTMGQQNSLPNLSWTLSRRTPIHKLEFVFSFPVAHGTSSSKSLKTAWALIFTIVLRMFAKSARTFYKHRRPTHKVPERLFDSLKRFFSGPEVYSYGLSSSCTIFAAILLTVSIVV